MPEEEFTLPNNSSIFCNDTTNQSQIKKQNAIEKPYLALLTKMNILKIRKIVKYLNEINLNIVT